ncbi:hypothetical protein [Streptomyces cupreus]|uniref:Uncharacterized protein n=1 Tax=Streptomyces cupreus TaxID=2759956 RepID=A0A7X1J6E7_9ACTN|nr:hypothetical protein [Streptomyces cupreus]MBC2904966.1 hypothetical protein [Streptomyces cupreus]
MQAHVLNRLINDWLARAHPVPEQAEAEWSNHGVALLPLSSRFAAVRMSVELVHAALACEVSEQVPAALAEELSGPVIHDHRATGPTYYALIQGHAGLVWEFGDIAPCLCGDTYLGIPRIDRRRPPGTYWAVPPRYDGDLCRPQAVRDLVDRGRRQLDRGTAVVVR